MWYGSVWVFESTGAIRHAVSSAGRLVLVAGVVLSRVVFCVNQGVI